MGIFGDDKLQDERIAALEEHVRVLTESLQGTQVDLTQGWIAILALQAKVDEKVSAEDVDPAIVKLNKDLGDARVKLEEASNAASESWATLQKGVRDAFERLRQDVHRTSESIKQD